MTAAERMDAAALDELERFGPAPLSAVAARMPGGGITGLAWQRRLSLARSALRRLRRRDLVVCDGREWMTKGDARKRYGWRS